MVRAARGNCAVCRKMVMVTDGAVKTGEERNEHNSVKILKTIEFYTSID